MLNDTEIMGKSRKRRAGLWAFRRPRHGLVALLGLLVLTRPAFCEDKPSVSRAYQIKAAYLYNFTKFVEWPPQRFPDLSDPIVIGVLGWNGNPFGDELSNLVRGRKVSGRLVVVKNVKTPEEAGAVHVLFVSTGLEQRWAKEVQSARSAGVLTVGESEPFFAAGGIITFVLKEDKVLFEINLDASEKAGLKLSAQLLKLAVAVHRKS
jgi:hypothetical protein